MLGQTGTAQKPGGIPPTLWSCVSDIAAETGRLVLMHSGSRWNATGGGQRPQQIAEALAGQAAIVHLSYGNQNMPVLTPSGVAVRKLAEAPMWSSIAAPHRVFYTSYPNRQSWDTIARLNDWCVVYDCVDIWQEFPGAKWYARGVEERIAQRADIVTCTAQRLVSHCEGLRVRQCDTGIKLLLNSTRIAGDAWAPSRDVDFVYVGWIDDTWLDWDLVRELAERGHTVAVIGPTPRGSMFDSENVQWVGEVHGSGLMQRLSAAKVGLIPFRDMPLVHAVNPIKQYDYMAAGLPTVASGFPELWPADHVLSVRPEDFVAVAEGALVANWDREAIAADAEQHTAAARASRLVAWLSEDGAW